jgi:hypothetical protein
VEKPIGFIPIFLVALTIMAASYGIVTWGPPLLRESPPVTILPATGIATSHKQTAAASDAITTTSELQETIPVGRKAFQYIEVVDGCGPYYNGTCANMRSGPGTDYPVVGLLRNGMVLNVADAVMRDGHVWYKIGFEGEVRYPERITGDWYVASDYVRLFWAEGEHVIADGTSEPGAKRIVVDLTKEILYAYDGDTLFMQQAISTGLELTPTAIGTFAVNRKMPSTYMQGPVPGVSDQYYDLPGVPWDLYFTFDGSAIHGAYWHNKFGEPWSHGCVNLPPDQAHILYDWADIGTPVIVQN